MDSLTITLNAMVITLALLLGRAAVALSVAASHKNQLLMRKSNLAAILTLITLFLIVVCAIATIDYAHRELRVPYSRNYMFLTVILIVLPLHVATECISRAAIHGRQLRKKFGDKMLNLGMLSLILAYVTQASYLTYAYLDYEFHYIYVEQFLFMFISNVFAIALPIIVLMVKGGRARLVLAILGLIGSASYVPLLTRVIKGTSGLFPCCA